MREGPPCFSDSDSLSRRHGVPEFRRREQILGGRSLLLESLTEHTLLQVREVCLDQSYMAPSRAGRARQHFLLLLVAALALSSLAESKDYYSDPAGKLHGKLPTTVVQEAVGARVKHSNPKRQNGVERETQPLEMYNMLSEGGDEVHELTAGKLGGKSERSVERDVWSDPEGSLKGRFSDEVIQEAVRGERSQGGSSHKKGSHYGDGQRPKSGRNEGESAKPLQVVDLLSGEVSDLPAGKAQKIVKGEASEKGSAAIPIVGTRERARAATQGTDVGKLHSNHTREGRGGKNSTRTREQSLKWGRKGRPTIASLLKKDLSDEFERVAAKLISASRKKAHKLPFAAQTQAHSHGLSEATQHGRSLAERRELAEADNQKLNLIGIVTQTAAVRAVINATEGVPVSIPAAGNGVGLVAVKVSTTSLQTTGLSLQGVTIPPGVQVPGNTSTVILVFSEFTENPYGFTNQTVVAPVVGVTAYDAADPNAGAANSTLTLQATPVAPFQFVFNTTQGAGLSCSSYNATAGQLLNTTTTTRVATGGRAVTCTATSLGTYTVVSTLAVAPVPAPAPAPGPAPVPAPGPAPAPAVVAAPPANVTTPPATVNTNNGSNTNGTIASPRDSGGSTISGGAIAGIVIGSVAGLAILALLALLLARRSEQSKIARMTQRSRNSEPLTTALIGGQQGFRAPVASHVRTRPGLESEIYP
ncbi:hypothetical protein KFL_004360030 [Klebsormidium nitens]|uniref:Uncharacterized protein n=1 Tax=Klebsormidium nitens TaxID=105231 RepID=A0A1Y1IHH9_KLENI|nr:hypothetical protein KFL_004360030 [Klebsormidium nitens]|eukprot:GAQ88521.1 hypothetical protein KFL_004360030 [Klebsormidium nitens]